MQNQVTDVLLYPFDDGNVDRVIVGTILSATSVLGIPGLILAGYYLQVLLESVGGETTPPNFEFGLDAIKEKLMYGFTTVFISSMYFFVVLLPLLTFYGVVGDAILPGQTLQTVAPQEIGIVGLIVLFSLLILPIIGAVAFAPISCTIYINQESIFKAFDPRRVVRVANTPEYALAVAKAILVGVVGSVLTMIVVQIPVIGYGVGFVVTFNVYLIGFHTIGIGIKESDPYLRNAFN